MEEPDYMLATPGLANALFAVSPERMNQQRHFQVPTSPSLRSSFANRSQRNSIVQEKSAKFDTMMHPTTQNIFQGKALERKTNDKALERAMLGREEAESEMRRYRDQAARQQESILALGRDNEKLRQDKRKVSERYELLMEKLAREKENYEHSKKAMETHTKQLRKESFKSQSKLVTLQTEAKAAQEAAQRAQEELAKEKKLSDERKQEAFTAKYELASVQQQLSQLTDAVKSLEQERDALRTIAKHEEVARVAAEGRIPLPLSQEADEFSSPRRLPTNLSTPYMTDNEEVEELRTALMWEKRRADMAYAHVSFLELECVHKACNCRRTHPQDFGRLSVPTPIRRRTSQGPKPSPKRSSTLNIFISSTPTKCPRNSEPSPLPICHSPLPVSDRQVIVQENRVEEEVQDYFSPKPLSRELEERLSPYHSITPPSPPVFDREEEQERSDTPSGEPFSHSSSSSSKRLSLMSLLNERDGEANAEVDNERTATPTPASPSPFHNYRTISTTTSIPLALDSPSRPRPISISTAPDDVNSRLSEEVFTPTLTREESLRRIQSMRGRTRSFANSGATPKKPLGIGLGIMGKENENVFRSGGHRLGKNNEGGKGHKRVESLQSVVTI